MFGTYRLIDLSDSEAFESLANAVREWEPTLDLTRPPRDARLFEPDGTLYAVAVGGPMSATYNQRERTIARGDALVVPQAVAIDIEPRVELIGVRHDGTPPDHFRERFIQVWGFEHFPAPPLSREGERLTEVIASNDLRFRLHYTVLESDRRSPPGRLPTNLDVVLLLGLGGKPRVLISGTNTFLPLPVGSLAAIGPGLHYHVGGPGRVGRLFLTTELVYQARRASARHAPSPEYSPGASIAGEGPPEIEVTHGKPGPA